MVYKGCSTKVLQVSSLNKRIGCPSQSLECKNAGNLKSLDIILYVHARLCSQKHQLGELCNTTDNGTHTIFDYLYRTAV